MTVLGSAILASLALVLGAVASGAGLLTAAPTARADGTWAAARPTSDAPGHLDQPAPGVHTALTTAQLISASGVLRSPARYRTVSRLTRSSSTDSVRPAPVQLLSVPGGEAVLGSLGTHVSPSCSTTDTNRVQVVFARETSTPSRYAELLPSLRSWVADVDDTFALSSPQSGRRVRWVIDAACTPVIPEVVVPDGALTNNVGATVLDPLSQALAAAGMNRPDRKYLVFADAPTQFCGVGQMYQDSSPSAANANNGGDAMYARVDPLCWPTRADYHSTPAHELMHMLGGVQATAPHATVYGHCTDEADALCYDDGSGQALVSTCTAPGAEALFDCNHDDYYDDGPAPTGYLAGAWNAASSSFLDVVPALGTSPNATTPAPSPVPPTTVPTPVTVTLDSPASLYVGDTAQLSVTLRPAVATGVTLETYSAALGWHTVARATTSAAGAAALSVRQTVVASVPVRAVVPGTTAVAAGRSAARSLRVLRRPTATVLTTRVGRPTTLTATMRTSAGAPLVSQYVTLQSRVVGTSAWRTVTRKLTNRSGQTAFPVRPTRRTSYRWLYAGAWNYVGSTSGGVTLSG